MIRFDIINGVTVKCLSPPILYTDHTLHHICIHFSNREKWGLAEIRGGNAQNKIINVTSKKLCNFFFLVE